MNNTVRTMLSIFVLVIYVVVNFTRNSVSTLIVGQQAGGQLANSDTTYIGSIAGMQLGQHWGISLFGLLLVLAIIWWKNLKSVFTS